MIPLMTLNLDLTTIVSGIILFVLGAMWAAMTRHWRRQAKMHKLMDIKVESIIHAVEFSLNGQGKAFRVSYENKKDELMEEHKFTNNG